jgi:phosphatidyl-myo-inositol dimannoside synthase
MNSPLLHIILCDEASPEAGGIQNMGYWIACKLHQCGEEVVVAGWQSESGQERFRKQGIKMYLTSTPVREKNSSDINLLKLYLGLYRRYGRQVLLHSLLIQNIKIYRYLSWLLRWRCVAYLHGNEIVRMVRKRPGTLRKNVLACKAVFSNSRYTHNLCQSVVQSSCMHIIHPAIAAEEYVQLPDRMEERQKRGWQEKFVVLMLSRLVARKGHFLTIEALNNLVKELPQLHLVIAGSGSFETAIRDKLEKSVPLQGHYALTGRVTESEKREMFRACDAYVMPSDYNPEKNDVEGFGISFLEAAALGSLAIGSDCGGISDAIEHKKSGYLVEPGNQQALQDILRDILTQPENHKPLADYARERALVSFNWDNYVDQLQQILKTCVYN